MSSFVALAATNYSTADTAGSGDARSVKRQNGASGLCCLRWLRSSVTSVVVGRFGRSSVRIQIRLPCCRIFVCFLDGLGGLEAAAIYTYDCVGRSGRTAWLVRDTTGSRWQGNRIVLDGAEGLEEGKVV